MKKTRTNNKKVKLIKINFSKDFFNEFILLH